MGDAWSAVLIGARRIFPTAGDRKRACMASPQNRCDVSPNSDGRGNHRRVWRLLRTAAPCQLNSKDFFSELIQGILDEPAEILDAIEVRSIKAGRVYK
jgi:hypothetical protein